MEKLPFQESLPPQEKERKEKPPILYHASYNPDIEVFEPRQRRTRDPNEGPVIFATPDKSLATMFLVADHNDSWTKIGYFNGVPVMILCIDRDEFIKKDQGGTLYTLPSETFDFDPKKGMGKREWTSHSPVKPSDKETHTSALESMITNGVQVYFVDRTTFEQMKNADDHGHALLLSLQSENESRGLTNPLRNLES